MFVNSVCELLQHFNGPVVPVVYWLDLDSLEIALIHSFIRSPRDNNSMFAWRGKYPIL